MIAPVVKELVHAFISETEGGALRAHLDNTLEGPVLTLRAASAEACQPRAGRIMLHVGQASFEVCAIRYPDLVLRPTETSRLGYGELRPRFNPDAYNPTPHRSRRAVGWSPRASMPA